MHTYRTAILTFLLAIDVILTAMSVVMIAMNPTPDWIRWILPATIVVTTVLLILYFWGPQIERWFRRAPRIPVRTDWHEFRRLPLKWAACMWVSLPPVEESLKDPRVQTELNRLLLAVRERKLKHPDSLYYLWKDIPSYDPDVANVPFSRAALVQYALKAKRGIPGFLKPTLKRLKAKQEAKAGLYGFG